MRESLDIVIQVLSDWRVIAVTIGTIAVWALLRYVGSVYRRPKPLAKRRVRPEKAKPAQKNARSSESERDEEMVE